MCWVALTGWRHLFNAAWVIRWETLGVQRNAHVWRLGSNAMPNRPDLVLLIENVMGDSFGDVARCHNGGASAGWVLDLNVQRVQLKP